MILKGNRGGIEIQGSSGSIEGLALDGQTNNGILRISQSPNFHIGNSKISDWGANAIFLESTAGNSISGSEIKSSATGVYLNNSHQIRISQNKFLANNIALQSANSSFAADFNLFTGSKELDLMMIRPYSVSLLSNTISATAPLSAIALRYPIAGESKFNATKNIVVSSSSGINIENASAVSHEFNLNDFYGAATNYKGISDQTGLNGNISKDPLFGPDYCLKPGSPAIYGDLDLREYMGHKGPYTTPPANCNQPCNLSVYPQVLCEGKLSCYVASPMPGAGGYCRNPLCEKNPDCQCLPTPTALPTPTRPPTPTAIPRPTPTIRPTPSTYPTFYPLPTKTPPSFSPTPTPTPFSNHPPVITTRIIRFIGKLKNPYLTHINGYDLDLGNTLSMQISGLPRGLTYSCLTEKTSRLKISCRIGGVPQQRGYFVIFATLQDNYGATSTRAFRMWITR